MRRTYAVAVAALILELTLQDTAFARRHGRGRRGGFGGTAASAAMMGYAAMMRAQGVENLYNSQAAINWEKAKTAEIQNRVLWTETYFKLRKVNHDMRLADRGSPVSAADVTKLAHDAVVPALDGAQFDQATGKIAFRSRFETPPTPAFARMWMPSSHAVPPRMGVSISMISSGSRRSSISSTLPCSGISTGMSPASTAMP